MSNRDEPDAGRDYIDLVALMILDGGDRHAPDLVISPREAVTFLVMSAKEYAAAPCEESQCEVCYSFVASWKSLYQALGATDRLVVEGALEQYDVRAPTFPSAIR